MVLHDNRQSLTSGKEDLVQKVTVGVESTQTENTLIIYMLI